MPRPIIFCGPSGVGKSTMIKKLFSEFPKSFGLSCSHTSRLPRQGETDNIDYHFTGRQEFLELVEKGEFIEHAEFAGNLYGTSYSAVESVLNRGQNVVLDIDTNLNVGSNPNPSNIRGYSKQIKFLKWLKSVT